MPVTSLKAHLALKPYKVEKNLKINQKVSRMHSHRLGKLSASPLANSLHQNPASQNDGKRTGRVLVR